MIAALIALLKGHPMGLDAVGVRAAMGWPAHRQVAPYMSGVRKHLRDVDSPLTVPYLRVEGGDRYRLIDMIDQSGWDAGDQQRKGAKTTLRELSAEWKRESDRLAALGQIQEAVDAMTTSRELASAANLI